MLDHTGIHNYIHAAVSGLRKLTSLTCTSPPPTHQSPGLNVRNISNGLVRVTDWYNLGIALDIPTHKLDTIRINHHDNVGHCKFSLYDLWLRTDLDASWSKLAKALSEAGEEKCADWIREKYLGIVHGRH